MKKKLEERPVQYFTKEYLENCKKLTPMQILKLLDDYRILHLGNPKKPKKIILEIPETLLSVFKTKAKLKGVPYQTKIKELMKEWTLH